MTDPVASNPALSGQVPAALPGTSALPASFAGPASAAATPSAPSTPPPDSPFTALLLGLRASPGNAADTTGTAMTVVDDPAAGIVQATPPGGFSLSRAAAQTLPGNSIHGSGTSETSHGSGQNLPEGGNDLPLPDVDALLASLEQPVAGNMSSAAHAPNLLIPPASVMPPAPGDGGGAQPGTAMDLQPGGTPGGALISLQQHAGGHDRAQAAPAWQDKPADQPAAGTGPAAADASQALTGGAPGSPAPRGMELALPAEFRARLESALAMASRPAIGAEGQAGTAPLFAAAPAALAGMTFGGSAMPPDPLPPLQPPAHNLADNSAWSQGLGDRLMMMVDKGLQTATLRLQPEHLGPVEIRLNVDDQGSTQILFSAHNAQTRDALETAIPRLREMFAEQGLSLMQANVDSGSSAFAQRGFAADSPFWNRWSRNPAEMPAADPGQGWQVARPAAGRLDVLV